MRHLSTGRPVPSSETLAALQKAFEQLNVAFAASHPMEDADKAAIAAYADELWRRMLRTTINSGVVARGSKALTLPSGRRFSRSDLPYSFLGRTPFHGLARQRLRRLLRRPGISTAPSRPGQASDTLYEQIEMDGSRPPTMFVVVDTEAEFNWDQPFARDLTGVTAMDDIERGQAVFDHYGLRPVYVVDFPIASQDRSVRRMRAMLDRGACYIGAHLHPWTTPPFEETLSDHNSFPGNLTPDQEEQKLVCLLATIHERLGVMPLFYKAGRYGCGLATKEILIRHGIKVDLSVLPGADLRGKGGPNFGAFESVPVLGGRGKAADGANDSQKHRSSAVTWHMGRDGSAITGVAMVKDTACAFPLADHRHYYSDSGRRDGRGTNSPDQIHVATRQLALCDALPQPLSQPRPYPLRPLGQGCGSVRPVYPGGVSIFLRGGWRDARISTRFTRHRGKPGHRAF